MDKARAFEKLLRPAQGIIFDFDGFLADSEKYHLASYKEVFARYGHTIDETEYYKYWTSLGHGAKGEIDRHKLDIDPLRIRDEKIPIFSRYCEDGSIKLFPQTKELLDLFVQAGKKLAIASGSSTRDIRAVLRNGGAADRFEAILGSDTVVKIKPAPDIFLKAADALGVATGDCLVFEDAEKGMLAAIAAQIPVVIVRTPETQGFDFTAADVVLESHVELLELARRTS